MGVPLWLSCLICVCIITTVCARSIPRAKRLSKRETCTCTETSPQGETGGQTGGNLPYVLRIGAFNIKTFGTKKMEDEDVAGWITEIVTRYDVILIQEIRDISQESVIDLHQRVNATRPYGLAISARLGRTSYKEQYAYFYRLDRLTLIDTLQYIDTPEDVYEREPYSVRLRPIGQGVTWDFALTALHAKPEKPLTREEIESLIDVYDNLRQTWQDVEDVILLGDFNADCSYLLDTDLAGLPIYNPAMFDWLIGFDVDTTTGTTDCAYDRIVASGPNLANAVIPESAGIYKFEDALNLSDERRADVSDHYPVEVEIY